MGIDHTALKYNNELLSIIKKAEGIAIMYENLKGKKLLIIGSAIETEIVNVAKEMGIYTIVADNVTDKRIARAKAVADESWDVSFFETEEIVRRCRENNVSGVFAAYGEFRVIAAARIAKALGLPYYATEEQINLTRNKSLFKEKCMEYGIPVPKNYYTGSKTDESIKEAISYPVIVKPTDRSGRIGISICKSEEELDKAIELALEKSESKTYLVEQYIEGTEFSAGYSFIDGEISLSFLNEKYITDDQLVNNFLCDCVVSPAFFLDRFKEEINDKFKSFLAGIGVKNGIATFQGIVADDRIYVFETGLRVNGNNDWKIVEKCNGINYVKMMISHSLTGEMGDDLSKDNPYFDKYYCTLPFYSHGGTIAKLEFDKVLEFDWAEISSQSAGVGTEILEDGTARQKVISIIVEADNYEQLLSRIEEVQKNIIVENEEGISLLFEKFNTNKLVKSI
ncbi:MAG: ATP-grasp domain-containing protein [Butyrivibrio sp.]|nr:ATP-grasp domain-containing protein [Butyrivibrio sp.]